MYENRTDPGSPNYQAAIWYSVDGAIRYLIDLRAMGRGRPYDTPLARERLSFFEARLKAMPSSFQEMVRQKTIRLPSPGCSEFIEIDAAENVAGIVLAGGTLVPMGGNDFDIVGYNEMIEAFSYDLLDNLSPVTVPCHGETPAARHYRGQYRRTWQAEYRAHIRAIAILLQTGGMTAAAHLLEAA